jgi:hypothetical protein
MGGIAGLVAVLPLVGALMLANGASWGFGGQLQSSTFPSEWAEARRQVAAEPGTVVAFPWFEYFSLDIADNRLVLNVVPFWFGGDTVASTDPMLTPEPAQESTDPREASGARIAEAARAGEPVADALARLGVRWVVLQHDIGWQTYTGVLDDPGLEPVVEGPTLTLYRVRPWAGLVVGEGGEALDADPVVSPLMTVPASGPATWAAPYQDGWLRGTSAATQTADGLVALPGGSGPVWFWPAVVVLVADLVVLAAVVATAITRPRGRWARRREARRVQLTDATS